MNLEQTQKLHRLVVSADRLMRELKLYVDSFSSNDVAPLPRTFYDLSAEITRSHAALKNLEELISVLGHSDFDLSLQYTVDITDKINTGSEKQNVAS